MRKLLFTIIFIVFALVITVPSGNTYAQEDTNYNRSYQDYTYNFDEYRKAEAKYQLKRSEYLRHKTLSSKNESIDATREFLKTRDQVTIAYLTAIRRKLEETPGTDGVEKEPYYAKLDSEVRWYQEHKDRLDTAASLDDLVDDSDEASKQYSLTEIVSYEVLTAISTGKINSFRGPLRELISKVKSKISEIRQVGDKDVSIVEKWVLDAENEETRSGEKTDTAMIILAKMKESQKSTAKRSTFNSSQEKMSEAHQHTKEVNRFLGEIITEIKTAD
jgi:hypothetical protein